MRKARWLAEWRKSTGKPVFYHVISRVVDRQFVFGVEDITEGQSFSQKPLAIFSLPR